MRSTSEQEGSRESILAAVERELRQRFGRSHQPDEIRQAATASVDELLGQEPRVKAFVPVLAGRRARERLRRPSPRAR